MYIFCFLHQTTTRRKEDAFTTSLYIFCFLHQTTTLQPCAYFRHGLYIFCFLHQTTTPLSIAWFAPRCISFVSYIKPQPSIMRLEMFSVVYLLFPTSNHNAGIAMSAAIKLYIFCFLHQTTTDRPNQTNEQSCISFVSYIKPQRHTMRIAMQHCCISFVSYIKPQRFICRFWFSFCCISFVSYIKPQRAHLF